MRWSIPRLGPMTRGTTLRRGRPACRRLAALALASLLAVGCGAGGPPAAPAAPGPAAAAPAAARAAERTTIGTSAPSLSYLPVFLAEALGYYREEAVAPEFVRLAGSVVTAALMSGELDFSTLAGAATANAAQGGPSRVVQLYSVRLQHVLSVRPEITSVQQLSGKRLAVQGLGTLTGFEARKLVEHFGLRDVAVLAIGSDMERIAALEAGSADASPLTVPANILAERRGFPTLLRIGDVIESPTAGLATTERLIQERADLTTRVLRAIARAIPAIHGQRERTITAIAEWLELTPEDAARAYEQVVDTYSPNGLPTAAQMAAYLDLMRETAGMSAEVTAAQVADFTIARRVAAELGLPGE